MKKAEIKYFSLKTLENEELIENYLKNMQWDEIAFQSIQPDKNANWLKAEADDFTNFLPLLDKSSHLGKSKKTVFKDFFPYSKKDSYIPQNTDNKAIAKKNIFLCFPDCSNNLDFFSLLENEFTSPKVFQKTLLIPRFRWDEAGNQQDNITDWGLEQFKNHYETQWQSQVQSNKFYLKSLFDFSEFENCQVEESLAFEIRQLILIMDKPQEINYLTKNINQPEAKIEEIFQKIAKTFREVKRAFDRLGKKACKSGESFEILNNYFTLGEEAVKELSQMIEKSQDLLDLGKNWESEISKTDIFCYTYAVLNYPTYQQRYELNLKRNYPHLPFYVNFWQWVAWGKNLISLLTDYQNLSYPILKLQFTVENKDILPDEKLLLKIDKANQQIFLNNQGAFLKIPPEVWQFQFNGKSFLEWVLLDKKNENRQEMIDLIQRICFISTETLKTQRIMEAP